MIPHSLTHTARRRHYRPLPEDEADLFNAGEAGHERIEYDALSALVRDPGVRAQIYFGNWQRDMSQLLVPAYPVVLGSRSPFLCSLIFQIMDVLAEAKFGRRLDPLRFGVYRWEEHIDNPRQFGIALQPGAWQPIPAGQRRFEDQPDAHPELWHEGRGALPNYLLASQEYVMRQLGLAMQAGNTARGREHLGNALHTVEDHYAHSNFIDLALNHIHGRGDPMTGRMAGSNAPIRDSLGRYRLTTGVFLLADTVVSLQEFLLHQIEGRPPGSPPSNLGKRVMRVLVARLLGQGVLNTYDRLLRAWEETGIPALAGRIYDWTGLPDLERALETLVYYPLRQAIARLLQPLVDAAARQTGNQAYPVVIGGRPVQVIEISHSRLSKDSPHHAQHGLARRLAIVAVRAFWEEISRAWAQNLPPNGRDLAGTRFRSLVDTYMNHPLAAGDWWRPILGGPAPAPIRPQPPAPALPQPAPPPAPQTPPPPAPGVRPHAVLERFAFDRATLLPAHLQRINQLARQIIASANTGRPVSVVRLAGHADSAGPAAYNLRLGQARAQAAQRALARALERQRPGASQPVRFEVQSLGEARPAFSNASPSGRARNRRVEIYLQ